MELVPCHVLDASGRVGLDSRLWLRKETSWRRPSAMHKCRMVALRYHRVEGLAVLSSFRPPSSCVLDVSAMARKDAIVPPNSQFHISRHQFHALLASHKAFHEVAIKVTDILQDPSRSAKYQLPSDRAEEEINVNYIGYGQTVSKRDSSVSSQKSGSIGNHSKPQIPYQQERQPAPDRTLLDCSFQIGNERARRAYKQKRERSINLYARASLSFLDAEYDFQCMSAP